MQKTAAKFIWSYLKDFKYILLMVLLTAILSRLAIQSGAYVLASVFSFASSEVSNPQYWETLIKLLLFTISLSLIGSCGQALSMWIASRLVPHLRSVVIKDVFSYVNKHSISYFTNEMAGNISNKFGLLQSGIVDFFMQSGNVLFDFCFLLVNLGILIWISPILSIVLVLWLVVMFFTGRYFGCRRAALSKQTSSQQSRCSAVVIDSIANYSEIKSFANYKYERTNLLKNLRQWRQAESKEQKQKCLMNLYLSLVADSSVAFFVFVSLGLLYFKNIGTTDFIFLLTIFGRLSGVVFAVNWAFNNMSRLFGQIDSALETLAVEPEIVDSDDAKELKIKTAAIKFNNVGFFYSDKQVIFDNFNLSIKAGEKVGIVGSSGAGKSTLIKLIDRYFDVKSGSITINDHDIRDITQDSLHKHISVIPQDVCLFNRSLSDNIKYGNPKADEAEVIKAAKQASADKFIEKFPDKYQTKVGDRGVILSGGERQRIAIARALLKNAPILIFDEATSSLDSESEKYIQESLKILMKNKTVIAIAHRLSTLREMDRIIVLENGKIVEQGSHLSLLRQKGRYAQLFKLQSDGYIQSN